MIIRSPVILSPFRLFDFFYFVIDPGEGWCCCGWCVCTRPESVYELSRVTLSSFSPCFCAVAFIDSWLIFIWLDVRSANILTIDVVTVLVASWTLFSALHSLSWWLKCLLAMVIEDLENGSILQLFLLLAYWRVLCSVFKVLGFRRTMALNASSWKQASSSCCRLCVCVWTIMI